MIHVKNTPNNTGVAIYGDNMDFEELYEALHTVVGDEGEFVSYDTARIRVLGVCYDIRHALQGDREIEFVDNGMDADKMKWMSVITPDKNVYLKINVLWPEMLFVTMALNDFIRLYARKKAKKSYDVMLDRLNIWDESIAHVRVFQAAIAKCIKKTVSEASFRRMMNLMNKDYTWVDGYATQYLDILNCRFLDMSREKRLKSIPTIAKRLAELGDEYRQVKAEIVVAAKKYNTAENNIRALVDYPEHIEW
ncbi:MAG: hypothetical protein M1119_11555 [Firmicutes bacterium]|nr:hypothetical protein [Bacillota bacterium]